jgi:hypothetical protein
MSCAKLFFGLFIAAFLAKACLAGQLRAASGLVTSVQDGGTIADVNNDGKPDVVAVRQDGFGGTVLEVSLGNGDGTFQAPIDTNLGKLGPLGTLAQFAAAGDVNGDGKLDIVLFQLFSPTRTIFVSLGNGNGSFQPPQSMDVSIFYSSFILADFNGDGKVDLAAINFNSFPSVLSIFPGNGDGTFRSANSINLNGEPTGFVLGDFNLDGKPDLAIADSNQNLTVFLNNGSAAFTTKGPFPTGSGSNTRPFATIVAAGDLNGDGKLDVVLTDSLDGTVSVLLGNGDGTFQPFHQFPAGLNVSALGVVDLNEDGIPDLVVGNQNGNNLGVLLGNGDGNFKPMVSYGAGGRSAFNPIFSADFNGDGHPDVMIFVGFGEPALLFGAGDGTFPLAAIATSVGVSPVSIALADFNKDGKLDFVTGNVGDSSVPTPGSVTLGLSNGDGTFKTSQVATGVTPNGIAAGDFNKDGNPDFVITDTASNTLSLYLGNGDGTFQMPASLSVDPLPNGIAVADVNNDGNLDLIVTHGTFASHGSLAAPERIAVLLGNGDGTFQGAQFSTPSQSVLPLAVAVADYNGDGKLDIVVADQLLFAQPYLLGNGAGVFSPLTALGNDDTTTISTGDFNGDHKPDVAVAGANCTGVSQPPFPSCVRIYINNGFGTLTPVDTTIPFFAQSIASADFDGDHNLDIALSYGFALLGTMKGNGDGTLQAPVHYVATSTAATLVVGDVNNDGAPDLLALDGFSNNVVALLNVGSQPPAFPPDFGISTPHLAITLSPGQSGSFAITLKGFGAFTNPVNFSCSGLPALSTCNFSPSTVTPGGSPSTVNLTIATSGTNPGTVSARAIGWSWSAALAGMLAVCAMVLIKPRHAGKTVGLIILIGVGLMSGCGGGSSGPGPTPTPTPVPSTPSGISSVVVHASSSSGGKTIVHNIPLTLTVK